MEDYKQLFQRAVTGFIARSSPKDIDSFKLVSTRNVKAQILMIQRDLEKIKGMVNFTRIELFVQRMDEFEKAIESLDLDIPNLPSYLWGPTRLVLLKSKELGDALDCVLRSYNRFGEHLPLLSMYRSSPARHSSINICLARMYRDLLQFNSSLIKLFETASWKKTFMANWRDSNEPFSSLLLSFDFHGRFLKDTIQAQQHATASETQRSLNNHMMQYQRDRDEFLLRNGLDSNSEVAQQLRALFQNYSELYEKFRSQAETQETLRKNSQKNGVVHWLRSPGLSEPEWQDQIDYGKKRMSRTGRWFLNDATVKDWIEGEVAAHQILWVHGKKGAGKTILASTLIDHLTNLETDRKTSWYYCRESDSSSGEPRLVAIMKSLLRQMVGHTHDLLPTLHERKMNGRDMLSDEKTAAALLDLFCDINLNQFIVIDGLDELKEKDREPVVQFINNMVEKCDNRGFPSRIRVMFLSTDLSFMRKLLDNDEKFGEYAIRKSSTDKDLEIFIKVKVEELKKNFALEENDAEVAKALIFKNSNGMMLYADLVLGYLLDQPNRGCVKSELQDEAFPETLSDVYKTILDDLRITQSRSRNSWEMTKKIFGWLSKAKRPLKLYELQAAIAITFDNQGRITVQDPDAKLRKDIRTICGPLVHIVGGERIEFVHSTAREFVVQEENIIGDTVECDLVRLCLGYLSHPCFRESRSDSARKGDVRSGYFAFQDYATAEWFSHLKSMINKSSGVFDDPQKGPEYTWKMATILQSFYTAYRTGIESVTTGQENYTAKAAEEAAQNCQMLQNRPELYSVLLPVWTHVVRHHKQPFKKWNQVSIPELGKALTKNREALSGLVDELDSNSARGESLKEYYGENIFKCPEVACDYFYEGFPTEEALKYHKDRHKRPFRCLDEDCSFYKIGFPTGKDRDKHNRTYHPEQSDQSVAVFAQISRPAVADGRHQCEDCPRTFTRRANLIAHRDSSHLMRRPYECSTCGKAFTRNNDRRRHEKHLHVRRQRR